MDPHMDLTNPPPEDEWNKIENAPKNSRQGIYDVDESHHNSDLGNYMGTEGIPNWNANLNGISEAAPVSSVSYNINDGGSRQIQSPTRINNSDWHTLMPGDFGSTVGNNSFQAEGNGFPEPVQQHQREWTDTDVNDALHFLAACASMKDNPSQPSQPHANRSEEPIDLTLSSDASSDCGIVFLDGKTHPVIVSYICPGVLIPLLRT